MKVQTAVLTTGDKIDYYAETNDGIETDCGLIPWQLVDGFLTVHQETGMTMYVPK